MELVFLTGNANKITEANEALKDTGISLVPPRKRVEKLEIQDSRVENISLYAAKHASRRLREPFVVEDDGLFVRPLNGFPGPYTAYALKTIGIGGLLKLLEGSKERDAYFLSAVTLHIGGRLYLFTHRVDGTISLQPRGSSGFGFDPVFIPNGYTSTYAEMDLGLKSKISHRAGAFRQMAAFLKNYYEKFREG
ncbi:MAG: RdgB/HAM1 family non-canonical purine NTP pyrophosphatase [Nitrososphaeria archaeon]